MNLIPEDVDLPVQRARKRVLAVVVDFVHVSLAFNQHGKHLWGLGV